MSGVHVLINLVSLFSLFMHKMISYLIYNCYSRIKVREGEDMMLINYKQTQTSTDLLFCLFIMFLKSLKYVIFEINFNLCLFFAYRGLFRRNLGPFIYISQKYFNSKMGLSQYFLTDPSQNYLLYKWTFNKSISFQNYTAQNN